MNGLIALEEQNMEISAEEVLAYLGPSKVDGTFAEISHLIFYSFDRVGKTWTEEDHDRLCDDVEKAVKVMFSMYVGPTAIKAASARMWDKRRALEAVGVIKKEGEDDADLAKGRQGS